jgi:glycosyltransferase involved in cell wall biosynthesis
MRKEKTTKENCAERLRELKCCVIIPTYNNAQMLEQVIEDSKEFTTITLGKDRNVSHLMVVNDGSSDNTKGILERHPFIMQLSYTPNEGKGIAMRRGFEHALEQGYDYAITLDSDGQHYAKDIPVFVDALMENKNAIVIGARNMGQENVPTKSSFGNKFSSFWLWVETGVRLTDTQSGYRLYPIRAIKDFRFVTGRYEFEVEVLARAAWEGIYVFCAPIDVFYPAAEERVTHFRPFRDFFRISVLNTFLCILAFFWFRPRMFLRSLKKKA